MRRILQSVILALLPLRVSAVEPVGKIQGQVLNSKTLEPIVGANVLVLDTNRGSATDLAGAFTIANLPVGSYRLRFSHIGYEALLRTEVIVTSGRTTFVNVKMLESFIVKPEVVASSGYFTEALTSPASSTQLLSEEIRRFPGGFEDIVRTVSTLPGVAVVSEGGRNDLLVRGGGPSENLYLINNIEVPNINHFGTQGSSSGALSFVNLDFVENVEFTAGGFDARYGDKMSSVLALDIRPGQKESLGGEATVSATQYGLSLEGPLARNGDFLFSARKSYLDLIFKAANLPFVPVYTDFNFFANYNPTARDRLSFIALAALDRVDRDQGTLENRVTNAGILDNTQNQLVTGVNYRHVASRGFFEITLHLNRNEYRFSQLDESQREYFNSRANEMETGLKLATYVNLSQSSGFYAGASTKVISNDNVTAFADTIYDRSGRRLPASSLGLPQFNSVNASTLKHSAYFSWEQQLAPQLDLGLGIRVDYFQFLQKSFYPALRFALGFRPSEAWKIKMNAGRYYQSPSYVWTVNPANRALRALRNDMGIFGIDYLLREDLNLSFEAYAKIYEDLPTGIVPEKTDYLVLTNTGVGFGGREDDFQSFGYSTLVSRARGRAWGFEALLQKRFATVPCYGQIAVSYAKSEYQAGDGRTYAGAFDQRWIINLSGGYKFNAAWEISTKWRYFTGAPYTPVYLPAENGGQIQNLPDEYLTRRLRAGHHLDLRVDRRFNFSGWAMIVFLDIQNVYNYKTPRRPSYDFWKNTIADRNDLGILPSLGISAEF